MFATINELCRILKDWGLNPVVEMPSEQQDYANPQIWICEDLVIEVERQGVVLCRWDDSQGVMVPLTKLIRSEERLWNELKMRWFTIVK